LNTSLFNWGSNTLKRATFKGTQPENENSFSREQKEKRDIQFFEPQNFHISLPHSRGVNATSSSTKDNQRIKENPFFLL